MQLFHFSGASRARSPKGLVRGSLCRSLALAAFVSVGFAGAAEARRSPAPAIVPRPAPYASADSLEGNFLAAYIAVASRDTVAASHFYREALRDDPNNQELLDRAFVSMLADGEFGEASRAAEKIAARDPNNGLAQLTLAVRALKARQYGTARSVLSRSGRGRSVDLTALLLTAWSYAGAKDGKRALETIGSVRSDRGFAVFRDYHAALIADLTGNAAEAERRFKAAWDADKSTMRIVDAYGRFLARQGRRDEALALYRGYEGAGSRHAYIRAAIAALEAGQPLQPVVKSAQEGAAEVLFGLGSASTQQGDELASLIYLRLALVLDPENALATVAMADVFERMKQTDQAIAVLKAVPASSPLKSSADIQIGLSLEQLGRGDEAVAQLDKVKTERPDETEALVALANVLRSRKRYMESAEIYGQVLERMPKDSRGRWPILYYRGTAYERAKEWDKAEADLKAALQLVPETEPIGRSQVLNYLGYSWVDNGRNIDEAFKLLKRAVELNPRDGMIIDSLGWAYYRLGQYDDAVRELEKAAELKAGDPVINDHLGDAYWHVGRRLEARFQWQHAKDSNPEPEDLQKIEEKLQGGMPELPRPAEAGTTNINDQLKGGG
jgi:tetratricopeptide (TPR) repeat protein